MSLGCVVDRQSRLIPVIWHNILNVTPPCRGIGCFFYTKNGSSKKKSRFAVNTLNNIGFKNISGFSAKIKRRAKVPDYRSSLFPAGGG